MIILIQLICSINIKGNSIHSIDRTIEYSDMTFLHNMT
jgi:hypothetical protein